MSANFTKVKEKSGKGHKIKGKVREFVYSGMFDCDAVTMPVMCMDTCSEHHITYLYFVRTLMRFAYLMFSVLSCNVL